MTKYLVFKNQPDSEQTNVPGSREEMASEIANVVSQDIRACCACSAYLSRLGKST